MRLPLTRRLFNERIGLCAAAFFAVTESVIFLGNFATYDATCLSLLALAAWIMVRTAGLRWPVFLLAALPAALAVGVKYAVTVIQSTTTNRAQGITPYSTILREAAEWGGVLFAAAAVGTIA